MDDLIRRLLFEDDLTPEERRTARATLADALETENGDAASARALQRWDAARRHVAERFRTDLPERRLLVLYALADEHPEQLSRTERADLDDARPQIEEALRRHPALEDVLAEIRRERDAFDAAWEEHTGRVPESQPPRRNTAAPDRSAASPGARRSSGRRAAPSRGAFSKMQRWGGRIAAVLALVAFAAALFFVFERDRNTVTVTAEGETPRLVELADGSTVRLAPGATLSYVAPESGAALDRQATLESGRAFFDIVPSQEGFLVQTPTARVTVLGTRFDVRAEERATRVVLASGRVVLSARGTGSQPVALAPGQMSRVADGALPTTPTRVEDLAEVLSWTGRFYFRETPAQAIGERLAAHYDQAVQIAPPLQAQQVTGTFDRDRPLRETLSTVAAALDARVEATPGGYMLMPDGP